MPDSRKSYSASRARRTSRKVHAQTVGTHVARRQGPQAARRSSDYTVGVQRRARFRRILVGVVAVAVVVGVALGAAFLAFRGAVGSEMALRDSDAQQALTAPKSSEAHYSLIAVELGAVAKPLETAGPDMLLLARVDNDAKSLALVNVPANLQVTVDNKSVSIASAAEKGDSALISAVKTFAKTDIAHIVKIGEGGIAGIVDALGGIDLDIDQAIDDPWAGDVFLPTGVHTLNGADALVYLRAENLKLGVQDKLTHQLNFTTKLLEKLFAGGGFGTRLDSVDSYFQTDCTLADLESVAAFMSDKDASYITTAVLPGYTSSDTGVDGGRAQQYLSSSEDMASILEALDEGRKPPTVDSDGVDADMSRDFTVEVQNGTSIAGAAAAVAEQLAEGGFTVGAVGNAEQQVYEETLVVYKEEADLPRAKAVIEALGMGRPVEGGSYYSFDADVLFVIGSDYTPIA